MNNINKRCLLISFIIFTFSIQIIISQNISELIQPKCSKKKIEYSIVADMQEYLDNENNIDGRELYESINDLKSKKIGSLPYFKIEGFNNVVNYDSYESLLKALRKHEVDAIFLVANTANSTQLITNDLSMIEGSAGKVYPGIICKNETLYKQLTQLDLASGDKALNIYYKWLGITEDTKVIKNNLSGNKVLTYLYINFPPFNYKDENGEITGSFVELMYGFASANGYKIEYKEVTSINELNQAIIDQSYDFIHYFRENITTTDYPFYFLFPIDLNPIIRHSNLIKSTEWNIYDSAEEYKDRKSVV